MIAFFILLNVVPTYANEEKGSLIVTLSGFQTNNGNVMIALP
jgi:hypothetical protein